MVVHGVAGSGKTALLRAFRAELTARVVSIDGRGIEPTPQGFVAAIGDHEFDVLVIDTAERLRLIDGWLRLEFLPSLPAHARVVIATRDAPGAVRRASFGELLQTIALGPLPPADAAEVLRAAGLDEDQVEWVNRFVRGHPLSLQLAASAVRERPDAPEDVVLPTVVQELAALYLDGLDPDTREVLDAASVLRRVTLSLLGALLPEQRAPGAFARLDALPFVDLGREGLVIHDTVRETVCALLRASDPVRHRRYRTAAWRQIRKELETPRWASVADIIALVEEPLVREAFFPSAVQHYAIETARADDGPAIAAITARHEAEDEVARMRAWWDAVPSAFRVARSPRGEVVAFTLLCEFSRVPRRLLADDPLCVAWRAHLRAQPVGAGDEVLLARRPSPGHRLRLVTVRRGAAARPQARVAGRRPEAAPRVLGRARGRDARAARPDRVRRARRSRRVRLPPDPARPWARVRRQLALDARRPRPRPAGHRPRRRRPRAAPGRRPDRAVEARMRRDALPDRPQGAARGARHAPARRLGLQLDGRLEHHRRRHLRPAAQARRPRGCPQTVRGVGYRFNLG